MTNPNLMLPFFASVRSLLLAFGCRCLIGR
jgi:hypothetical protein